MSLKIRGFSTAELYSKWNSSVSKSLSSKGLVMRGRAVKAGGMGSDFEFEVVEGLVVVVVVLLDLPEAM